MNTVEKLKGALERSTGLPVYYSDYYRVNPILEQYVRDKNKFPMCFIIVPSTGTFEISGEGIRDMPNYILMFIDLTVEERARDVSHWRNESRLEALKKYLFNFVADTQRAIDFMPINNGSYVPFWQKFDATVLGIMATVTIKEIENECLNYIPPFYGDLLDNGNK